MRALTGLIASLSIALGAAAPALAAKPKPSCAKKGSKTVLRTPDVRMFTVRGQSIDGEVYLYACLLATGRKQELATEFSSDYDGSGAGFDDVRVAGRFAAWHSWEFDGSCKADCPLDYDQSKESLITYDLRRGRVTRRSPFPAFTTYTAGSLALTQNGGLAWLSPGTPGPLQLVVEDRAGRRVLDSGDIAATSVRAEISIVSWVRAGVEHFARLR